MAKRAKSSFIKEFFEKSGAALLSSVKNIDVTEWVKDILHLRSKLRKYAIFIILSTTALTVLMLGATSYTASQFPRLGNGVGEILMGSILMIFAIVYHNKR